MRTANHVGAINPFRSANHMKTANYVGAANPFRSAKQFSPANLIKKGKQNGETIPFRENPFPNQRKELVSNHSPTNKGQGQGRGRGQGQGQAQGVLNMMKPDNMMKLRQPLISPPRNFQKQRNKAMTQRPISLRRPASSRKSIRRQQSKDGAKRVKVAKGTRSERTRWVEEEDKISTATVSVSRRSGKHPMRASLPKDGAYWRKKFSSLRSGARFRPFEFLNAGARKKSKSLT